VVLKPCGRLRTVINGAIRAWTVEEDLHGPGHRLQQGHDPPRSRRGVGDQRGGLRRGHGRSGEEEIASASKVLTKWWLWALVVVVIVAVVIIVVVVIPPIPPPPYRP
jgi:hypothetical protein